MQLCKVSSEENNTIHTEKKTFFLNNNQTIFKRFYYLLLHPNVKINDIYISYFKNWFNSLKFNENGMISTPTHICLDELTFLDDYRLDLQTFLNTDFKLLYKNKYVHQKLFLFAYTNVIQNLIENHNIIERYYNPNEIKSIEKRANKLKNKLGKKIDIYAATLLKLTDEEIELALNIEREIKLISKDFYCQFIAIVENIYLPKNELVFKSQYGDQLHPLSEYEDRYTYIKPYIRMKINDGSNSCSVFLNTGYSELIINEALKINSIIRVIDYQIIPAQFLKLTDKKKPKIYINQIKVEIL